MKLIYCILTDVYFQTSKHKKGFFSKDKYNPPFLFFINGLGCKRVQICPIQTETDKNNLVKNYQRWIEVIQSIKNVFNNFEINMNNILSEENIKLKFSLIVKDLIAKPAKYEYIFKYWDKYIIEKEMDDFICEQVIEKLFYYLISNDW